MKGFPGTYHVFVLIHVYSVNNYLPVVGSMYLQRLQKSISGTAVTTDYVLNYLTLLSVFHVHS